MFGNRSLHCKSEKEIEDYFKAIHNIFFNFIDHTVDMINYLEPNKKFMHKINTPLNKEKYNLHNLNFNPTFIKTHKGIFIEETEEELSYVYDRDDVVINKIEQKKVYMVYRLWMNNKMQHYERIYKRFQDVIADVGGVAEFINYIAIFISYLYNNYIIIVDTQILLSSLSSFNNNFEIINKVNNIDKSRNNNNLNIDNNSNNSNINIHITKFKSKKIDIFGGTNEDKEKDKSKSNLSNLIISSDNSKNQKIIKNDFNINISNNNLEGIKNKEKKKQTQTNNKISDKKKNQFHFLIILFIKFFVGKSIQI